MSFWQYSPRSENSVKHTRRWAPSFSEFLKELYNKLQRLELRLHWRRGQYGENIANDSPMGHTPPKIKEEYEDRMWRLDAVLELHTPGTDSLTRETFIDSGRTSPKTDVATITANNHDIITPNLFPEKRECKAPAPPSPNPSPWTASHFGYCTTTARSLA